MHSSNLCSSLALAEVAGMVFEGYKCVTSWRDLKSELRIIDMIYPRLTLNGVFLSTLAAPKNKKGFGKLCYSFKSKACTVHNKQEMRTLRSTSRKYIFKTFFCYIITQLFAPSNAGHLFGLWDLWTSFFTS
jgi:hypothetical protein